MTWNPDAVRLAGTISYCANGCTRKGSDGERHPRHAALGNLCNTCADNLDKWLREIPDRYAIADGFLNPTVDRDANPETKATKRANAPVPIRLEVLDLLDTRRGRMWLGLVPTIDRRGTLGTLLAIGNELRAIRGAKPRLNSTVVAEADYLRVGIDKLATITEVSDLYDEIKNLHRALGEAIGEHPPRPVAKCTITNDTDDKPCGGPIFAGRDGGAYCARCRADWNANTLALLGAILNTPTTEAS